MPTVCMHCKEPTCALVCPADAIKVSDEGVVMSALKPRCLDCRNCVNACPFGVPKYNTQMHLQMKCDMCYDRSSEGLRPMCASVCPTGAITFGKYEQIVPLRRTKPPFQAEFPYERNEEAHVTCREFCNFLGLTSAALFLGAGGFAAKAALDARKSESLAAARIEGAEVLAPNNSLNFNYPTERDSAILVRTADGAYHAYGQKCTHLSCPVYYSRDQQRLECPCHEGAFDASTGNVLYGPPPRPLDAIEVETRGGEVWAIGRKPSTDEHAG